MTSSPSSPITGLPAGSYASTRAPRQRQEISPSYTGSSGDAADEAGAHVGAAGERLQLQRRRRPPRTPSGSPPAAAARRSSRRPGSRGQVGQLARHDPGLAAGQQERRRGAEVGDPGRRRPAATARPRSGAARVAVEQHDRRAHGRAGDQEVPHHPAGRGEPEEPVARAEVVVQGQHLEVLEQDAAVAVHDRLGQARWCRRSRARTAGGRTAPARTPAARRCRPRARPSSPCRPAPASQLSR